MTNTFIIKKYILLFAFFLSITIQSSQVQHNTFPLLSLPKEIIVSIFNYITSESYKNIIVSKKFLTLFTISKEFLAYFVTHIIEQQNILLEKQILEDRTQKEIAFNNRFLLGFTKNKINSKNICTSIIAEWPHGILLYSQKDDSNIKVQYIPKENSKELLCTTMVTNKKPIFNDEDNINFIEWSGQSSDIYRFKMNKKEPVMNNSVNFESFIEITNKLNRRKTIQMLYIQLTDQNPEINLNLPMLETFCCYVKSLKIKAFHVADTLILPNIEAFTMNSPVKKIICRQNGNLSRDIPILSLTTYVHNNSAYNILKKLSLQFFVDENTNSNCFKDLEKLGELYYGLEPFKVTLSFTGNEKPNPLIKIQCPQYLKDLKLNNCSFKIYVQSFLKKLTINSPKKCIIEFDDANRFARKLPLKELSIEDISDENAENMLQSIFSQNPNKKIDHIIVNNRVVNTKCPQDTTHERLMKIIEEVD